MINPLTGRKVQIGGRTYKNLVNKGIFNQHGGYSRDPKSYVMDKLKEEIISYLTTGYEDMGYPSISENEYTILLKQLEGVDIEEEYIEDDQKPPLRDIRDRIIQYATDHGEDMMEYPNDVYREFIEEDNLYYIIPIFIKINREIYNHVDYDRFVMEEDYISITSEPHLLPYLLYSTNRILSEINTDDVSDVISYSDVERIREILEEDGVFEFINEL